MQALDHRRQIDGLRFFAFLAVFLVHSDVARFWWGSHGVSLFFVISGFLITRILIAFEDRPRKQALTIFYARRALRIFPAYYLVLGLAAATVGIAYLPVYVLYVMNWGIFFYTWIEPELVDIAWDPVRMYGIHFWSLCVEEQFYLVFPLVFSFLRPGRTRLCWLLALWGASIGFRFLFAAFLPKAAYGLIPLVCGEYLVAGAVGAVVFADPSGAARTRPRRGPAMDVSGRPRAGRGTVRAVSRRRRRRSTTSCTRRTCRRCWRSGFWRWCWDCGRRTTGGCSGSSTSRRFASSAGSATACI